MNIPVSRPSIGQDELNEVGKVLSTGWLGLGSTVFEFENAVKNFLDAKNVIAVNTGTSALHLALDGYGIGSGDEVIVPSLTFCASVQAITAVGASPVFCEIDPRTLNIEVNDIEHRITKSTKAIMPVHYCGLPCNMDRLFEIAKLNDLKIVEDAAHAFGSTYKNEKVGSFGDVTCFSFDPIKNITCGEGGAVVTKDDEIAELIRTKRILGIDKDTWHRYKNERSWDYGVITQGYRYHMSNINAAIGLSQLKKFEVFDRRKKEIVEYYNNSLLKQVGVELLDWNLDSTSPFSYIIRVLDNKRESLSKFLNDNGIDTGIHYIPNHIQPFFNKFKSSLPITEKVSEEILTLPLYYDMSDDQVSQVVEKTLEYLKK